MTLNLATPANYFIDACGGQIIQRPFTITSITNADGAMINPSSHADQALYPGFASASDGVAYDAGLNILDHLPYTVSTDCSIGAVIHQPYAPPEQTYLREFAVWTALATLPVAPCLSPPYSGTDKTIAAEWYVSTWNKGVLRGWPVPSPLPANYPDEDWMLAAIERRMLDICPAGDTVNGWLKAANNTEFPQRTYGQNIGPISNAICQWLNVNTGSDNVDLILASMMQWAVDNLGIIRSGGAWTSTGLHSLGRMEPNILAAAVMGGTEMLDSIKGNFIEFYTYDFVTQHDIDTPRTRYWHDDPVPVDPYTQDMLGMPEWFSALWQRDLCTPNWAQEQGYRSGNGGVTIGSVFLAQILGLRSTVNHEALFRYHIERFWPTVESEDGLLQYLWPLGMAGPALCTVKPHAGIFTTGRTRTIECSTPGVTIYGRFDGAAPSDADTEITEPVGITTGTSKFVAYDDNGPGPVLTLVDTVDVSGKPAPPSDPSITLSPPTHLA